MCRRRARMCDASLVRVCTQWWFHLEHTRWFHLQHKVALVLTGSALRCSFVRRRGHSARPGFPPARARGRGGSCPTAQNSKQVHALALCCGQLPVQACGGPRCTICLPHVVPVVSIPRTPNRLHDCRHRYVAPWTTTTRWGWSSGPRLSRLGHAPARVAASCRRRALSSRTCHPPAAATLLPTTAPAPALHTHTTRAPWP